MRPAFLLLALLAALPAAAAELPGPLPATVLAVVDGDTLRVRAAIWIDQTVEVAVRLRGVDAPERRGRCPAETAAAERAREWLSGAIGQGGVRLFDIGPDKYAGRVLARVEAAGLDLARGLIAAGLARPYDGGARRAWC